jgi:sec-independent protein translocase protein TatC
MGSKQGEMTFLDHLEELRWHIIRSLMAVVTFGSLAFIFSRYIFDNILFAPKTPSFFTNRILCELAHKWDLETICINSKPFQLISINMSGQFSIDIMMAIVAGLVLGFPYIIWELWRFIKPALYEKERRYTRYSVAVVSILFFTGVLFGFYIIAPVSVHFLGSYQVSQQVINQINVESYISTVVSIILASGVIFEMPALMFLLAKIGLVSASFLKKYRRHAYIVILIVAAIITPPDVFSLALVSIPLFLLFEISIIVAKRLEYQKLIEQQIENK